MDIAMKRTIGLWSIVGWIGYAVLPWYAIEDGFLDLAWIRGGDFLSAATGPAIAQVAAHGRWWLAPIGLALLLISALTVSGCARPRALAGAALTSLVFLSLQAWGIDHRGVAFVGAMASGIAAKGQPGLGYGAMLTISALLFIATTSISRLGRGRGDAFVAGALGAVIVLLAIFVVFPVATIIMSGLVDKASPSAAAFLDRLGSPAIWRLACLSRSGACGTAWNSLFLALLTATGTTLLGLAFALVVTRSGFRAKRLLRIVTVIPIITPPFVIGLVLIMLFGRSGAVTHLLHDFFHIQQSRGLYGLFGIWLSQMLSFTPIAFLVLIGVVEGVSPAMEEASQTLRADAWQTFRRVSFPLMRPGIANAFLISFIESLADFGNPLVLGGGYNVLSTDIYFSVVGAVEDQARAATLALVLLSLTLTAFLLQRWWVGNRSYTTVTGKADSGQHAELNPALRWLCLPVVLGWATFTLIVYGMILAGGFVKLWGYDYTITLEHYIRAFAVTWTSNGLWLKGAAWNSFLTTLEISAVAAPLTTCLGLLTAYLLVRRSFAGKTLFEFVTMLSFAIPGTVIGVSYILAFNAPPIELTGTATILVVCFIFRNMPVGVRSGIAAMAQLDKSLDEASVTLGANGFTTIRRVILPLLGPAVVASLSYSFVRAITSVSAVIFLVSAETNMATAYIVGQVDAGEYGIAIAYSSVLIVTMLAALLLFQAVAGRRRLRREDRVLDTQRKRPVLGATAAELT